MLHEKNPSRTRILFGSPWTHLGLIGAIALLAYANTFGVPFQFDDGNNIVENPAVRDLGAFFGAPGNPARAVGSFTFALNGSLNGLSVGGYHVVNLAIHIAASACVYFLTVFVCRAGGGGDPMPEEKVRLAGLAAAALFVAHPIQTQAVTYVVQRFASLVALFYLGTVVAYAHSATSPSMLRARAMYVAALVAGMLALFTKENAVTLPATLLVLELVFLPGTARERAFRLAPFWILALVFVLAVMSPSRAIEAAATEYRPVAAAGVSPSVAYFLTQPGVVLKYLRLILVPIGQNIDHDVPLVTSPLGPAFLVPLLVLGPLLGVATTLALRARRRSTLARAVLLGVGWFVATLSVESSVVPLADVMVEHRVYLPSVGIFLVTGVAAAVLSWRLQPVHNRVLAGAIVVVVAALVGTTLARNDVWRSRDSLWSDALAKSPEKSRPYVFVAQDYLDRGDRAAAISLLERASRLPNAGRYVFLNLGLAYANGGQFAQAVSAYREGLSRGGAALPGGHARLGHMLLALGRVPEACEQFDAALEIDGTDRAVRDNVAGCRYARGDLAGAAAEWSKLAEEDPRDPSVQYNLALALRGLGDLDRARGAFRRFLDRAGSDLAPQRLEAERWLASHPARE